MPRLPRVWQLQLHDDERNGRMTCPKESRHAELAHVDLGGGEYAHLKRKPTHAEGQDIQAAQHAANYETNGASELTQQLIRATLLAAPEEWRNGYTDKQSGETYEGNFEPTMAMVERFLDQYETDHETALLSPKTRRNMADARMALFDAYAKVFFVESSAGDSYPLDDAIHCEIVQAKARELWTEWVAEVRSRLKAAGADSD